MNKKMNKKKENRMAVRQAAATAVLRDEQNRRIQFAATNPEGEVLKNLRTTLRGLDVEAVAASRAKYGSNKVTHEKKKSLARRLAGAFINPFTAILFCLALVSTMTDMVFPYFSLLGSVPEDFDPLTVIIILTMVFISGTLRFVQESRSGNAAEKLLAMITTTCMVTRQEQEKVEIPMDDLVVGDIVHLSAGDMIPADVRILEAKDLFVSQASLTGESEPIEKTPLVSAPRDSVTDYTDIAFMGSNVISGSATAVAVCVGDQTLFGSMASAVAGEAVETSFTKGVNAVSWVLIRFMMVMVPLVFFINGITKGDWLEAFLFGISIAVGLTPEMLPMIVTTCLAKGAVSMSKKQTIVKNLNSIQNFGAIDILCTDKTGTLTKGVFQVTGVYPAPGVDKKVLLGLAAYAESGSHHPISQSLKDAYGQPLQGERVSAIQEIAGHGVQALVDGHPVAVGNAKLMEKIGAALPDARTDGTTVYVAADGKYIGCIVISDVVKPTAKAAMAALKENGVKMTVMLTGDAEPVAKAVSAQLGLDEYHAGLLPGDKVDQIETLIAAKKSKENLAFVGDGINDAPVLSRADVGIAMGALGSDAAIEAADVVLMDDDPAKIALAMRIARRTLRIVYENIVFALAVKFACLLLGAIGMASMWTAIFADVGVMVIAVLNATRALYTKDLVKKSQP